MIIWQADERVQRSYTVFTQLFDAAGEMVAQQDNLPVQGLAPTDSWTPGTPIRDAYKLQPTVTAGRYVLHVGLYDSDGVRVPVAAEDGGGDHIAFEVLVP